MSFGSINYVCRNVEPPKPRVAPDTFDYDALLCAMTREWELAGKIAARLGMRGQHVGKRLSKLYAEEKVLRHCLKTEIYWRLP